MYEFRFNINRYPGSKAINTLRCYPFDFHEDKVELTKKLIGRGQKWRNFQIQSGSDRMLRHKGDLIHTRMLDDVPAEMSDFSFIIFHTFGADEGSERRDKDWLDSVSSLISHHFLTRMAFLRLKGTFGSDRASTREEYSGM